MSPKTEWGVFYPMGQDKAYFIIISSWPCVLKRKKKGKLFLSPAVAQHQINVPFGAEDRMGYALSFGRSSEASLFVLLSLDAGGF